MVDVSYISKYRNDIKIILDYSSIICLDIPTKWLQALKEEDFIMKKQKIIDIWSSVCKNELSNTIQYLSDNLISFDLLSSEGKLYFLYGLQKPGSDKILYYEGKVMLNSDENEIIDKKWDALPESIKLFYKEIHNGFYYYASHSMGLSSVDEVTDFGEYDWGVIEDLDLKLELSLNSTFGFFTNGMGTYVAVDCLNCVNSNATIWFKNKPPKYDINFWDVVDEWIVIGFQS